MMGTIDESYASDADAGADVMTLELGDLRYFLEVRARGSLTAAGRALGISQPSLSAAMQRLERHFGTQLLLRGHRGVSLTVTGLALAADAQQVFDVLSRAERRVAGLEDDEVGRFVIGSHESLGAYFLPDFLRAFFAAHPRMDVSVQNANSAAVRDAVVDRSIDFGIVVNPRAHPDLVLVPLFEDAVDFFVLGVGGKSPARTLDAALARLAEGPLVHATRVAESQALIADLAKRGCVPARVLGCGDFELVKSLLLAGVGCGLLPRRVAAYGHEGKLVRLHPGLPHFADEIFLLYRADLHKTKAAVALKDALVAHGRRLRGRATARRPSLPPPA